MPSLQLIKLILRKPVYSITVDRDHLYAIEPRIPLCSDSVSLFRLIHVRCSILPFQIKIIPRRMLRIIAIHSTHEELLAFMGASDKSEWEVVSILG